MNPIASDALDLPFGDEVRAEGRELFDSGRIRLREADDENAFEARVPFFRRHHTVWLRRDPGGRIRHGCTCPHTVNTGEGCAHLFGLLLAIAEREAEAAEDVQEEELLPLYALEGGVGPLRVSLWLPPGEEEPLPRPLIADGETLGRIEDDRDRAVLGLLSGSAGGRLNLLEGGGFARREGPYEIREEDRDRLIARLAATGRLHLRPAGSGDLHPIEIVPEECWDLVLRLLPAEDGGLRLTGALWREGLHVRVDRSPLLVTGSRPLALVQKRLVGIRTFGAGKWLSLLARKGALPAGAGSSAEIFARLESTGALPRLWAAGETSPLPLEPGEPRGRLEIRHRGESLRARLGILYEGRPVDPGPGAEALLASGGKRQILRDWEAERSLLDLPAEAGLVEAPGDETSFRVEKSDLPALLDTALARDFQVLLDQRPVRAPAGHRLGASPLGDRVVWTGETSFGEERVPLDAVLETLLSDGFLVPVADGSLGFLGDDLRGALRPLASLADFEDQGLVTHRAQALLAAEMLAEHPAFADADLSSLRGELERLASPGAAGAPPGFEGRLRSYQETGLAWLGRLESAGFGGCLADDTGLGKTVQVLAHLLARKERLGDQAGCALIVVPRSVLWNWEDELRRFTPGLSWKRHAGPRRKERLATLGDHDVVLTTYGILRRDQAELREVSFTVLVLDEAQNIKNPDAQVSRAARGLRAPHRICLTGTPVENSLLDLWSLMAFLNPGFLGPRKAFMERMGAPDQGRLRAHLARCIAPLFLRRKKEDVAPELPEKVEQVLHAEPSKKERALYETLRTEVRAGLSLRMEGEGLRASRLNILEGLLRLRQAACHPGLVDEAWRDVPAGKVDLLVERLREIAASGHKALVFSQFTSFLSIVGERIEESGETIARLDGKTRDRRAQVERFQNDPACRIFLLSLKAGGVGLNLTAADYVFLLDPWWNPAAEAQAADRAHRIGRRGRVIVYRLVTRGTIEEKVLELQERKRRLVEDVFGTESGPLERLTREDLEALLS